MDRPPAADRRHVVLVGLMGSGKTTVGRELAARLGRPLIDNDAQIRVATGRTVAEIAATAGVGEMRRLEAEALIRALASSEPAVITAAAGTVLDGDLRARLRSAQVVWLRADPATLAARVGGDPTRPLLGDDPEAVLRTQAGARHDLYAAVADLEVAVDGLSPVAAAAAIAASVGQR